MATSSYPSRLRNLDLALFASGELGLWAAAYGAYLTVRGLTIGARAEAVAHARDVVSAERTLGLFRELSLQHALAPAIRSFSAYYMLGFGPVVAAIVVWLAIRRRDRYRALRNALLVCLRLATIVFVLFPTAPPRLVPGLGISDTVGLSGHDTGSFLDVRFNPFAAVPSMHVGWSVLVALAGFRAVRGRAARTFFALQPLLMVLAVSATGNHFFLDSLAGLTVAGATLLLLRDVDRPHLEPPLSQWMSEPRATTMSSTRDGGKRPCSTTPGMAESQPAAMAGASSSPR